MISTRIGGRWGLGPTSTAATRDRDRKSTRWLPHHIHPRLDNPDSIGGSFDDVPSNRLSLKEAVALVRNDGLDCWPYERIRRWRCAVASHLTLFSRQVARIYPG